MFPPIHTHLATFGLALSLVWAPACGQLPSKPPLLNSERIERKFGSYGIDILSQSHELRVSNLHSTHNGDKTCRTFAIVQFQHPIPDRIREIHHAIVSGQSLGATFKNQGWNLSKGKHAIGEIQLTHRQAIATQLMKVPIPSSLAIHTYELRVAKGPHDFAYCRIAEVHHPDYLTLQDLDRIYAPGTVSHETPSPTQQSALWRITEKQLNQPPRPNPTANETSARDGSAHEV